MTNKRKRGRPKSKNPKRPRSVSLTDPEVKAILKRTRKVSLSEAIRNMIEGKE